MKKGISLIVLVITIIVMIILATSVVITLSNTEIIDRASQAVDLADENQVQDLASLVWADAYMSGLRGEQLNDNVIEKLEQQEVTEDWIIRVSDSGVTIIPKSDVVALGSLLSPSNYGDTVDYVVTVAGILYDKWQIYYHNDEYVYLRAAEPVANKTLDKGTTVESLTEAELELYDKFRVGKFPKYTLKDNNGTDILYNNQAVAELIKDYAGFANKVEYGTNVIGAIGAPTLELLVAGWKAKEYIPVLTIGTGRQGYTVNGNYVKDLPKDGLYMPLEGGCWIASPANVDKTALVSSGNSILQGSNCKMLRHNFAIHPVVCLKATIPAIEGTTTNFSLVK